MKRIRFWLDGCDISFIASAPENITLKQCDRIKPDWCACGIKSLKNDENYLETEIIIDYDDIMKAKQDVACTIKDINRSDENE